MITKWKKKKKIIKSQSGTIIQKPTKEHLKISFILFIFVIKTMKTNQ